MKLLLSIIIISIILLVSCQQEEIAPPELPPITQEGANTFGCLINGEVWFPYSARDKDSPLDARYDIADNISIIAQYVVQGAFTEFNIILKDSTNLWEEKNFSLTSRRDVNFFFEHANCNFFTANQGGSIIAGELYVSRFDSWNKFISGTFWFTAVSDCDTVFVTDGRFDVPVFIQEG